MKVAKPVQADIDAAFRLVSYMDALGGGYMPEELILDDDVRVEYLDARQNGQYARLIGGLQSIAEQGNLARVVLSMACVLNPENGVIDPNASALEIHPALRDAEKQRDALKAALLGILRWHEQTTSGTDDQANALPTELRQQAMAAIALKAMDRKYAYAFSEDGPFYGEYDRFEDALRDGAAQYKELDYVFIGELQPHSCRPYLDVDNLLARLDESAYDTRHDISDDWITGITQDQVEQLKSVIADWLDERAPLPPDIANIRKVSTKQTDFLETGAPGA